MSHGSIRCMGTSLHLKNQYGEGYRLNVTARAGAVDEVKRYVAKELPGMFDFGKCVTLFSHINNLFCRVLYNRRDG